MNTGLPGMAFWLLTILAMSPAAPADAPGQLYVVHFSTGPAWDETLPPGEQAGFKEHSANLNRLRSADVILFGARYEDYGMLVVRAASMEEASDLFANDPGVRSGIFVFAVAVLNVFYPWQESASP